MLVYEEELCGYTGWTKCDVAYFCLTDKEINSNHSVENAQASPDTWTDAQFFSNYWCFIDRKSLPMWDFNL